MEITKDILDIAQYEAQKYQPATLIKRNNLAWFVRDLPMDYTPNPDDPLARKDFWGWCREGERVRVPLFPYCSRGNSPEVALGYAFELGIKARDAVDTGYMIKRLHISLGHPVEEVELEGQPVLRFWIGFAFGLREK